MSKRRATWWEDDPPAGYTIGAFTTGLPPELDADGKPIEPAQTNPIGFVRFGSKSEKSKQESEAMVGLRKVTDLLEVRGPGSVHLDYATLNDSGVIYIAVFHSDGCITSFQVTDVEVLTAAYPEARLAADVDPLERQR